MLTFLALVTAYLDVTLEPSPMPDDSSAVVVDTILSSPVFFETMSNERETYFSDFIHAFIEVPEIKVLHVHETSFCSLLFLVFTPLVFISCMLRFFVVQQHKEKSESFV